MSLRESYHHLEYFLHSFKFFPLSVLVCSLEFFLASFYSFFYCNLNSLFYPPFPHNMGPIYLFNDNHVSTQLYLSYPKGRGRHPLSTNFLISLVLVARHATPTSTNSREREYNQTVVCSLTHNYLIDSCCIFS